MKSRCESLTDKWCASGQRAISFVPYLSPLCWFSLKVNTNPEREGGVRPKTLTSRRGESRTKMASSYYPHLLCTVLRHIHWLSRNWHQKNNSHLSRSTREFDRHKVSCIDDRSTPTHPGDYYQFPKLLLSAINQSSVLFPNDMKDHYMGTLEPTPCSSDALSKHKAMMPAAVGN